MSEIINALEIGTTLAGYGVGQLAESNARHHIDQNLSRLGLGSHQAISVSETPLKKNLHRAGTHLALLGAMTGAAAGFYLQPQGETKHLESPALSVVVDHSFGTTQDGSIKNINVVASDVLGTEGIRVQPILAHNGGSDSADNEKAITDDQPFGPSSMAEATKDAIDGAFSGSTVIKSNALGQTAKHNAGVLVVNHGSKSNLDAKAVIEQAQEKGQLPVFIANAGKTDEDTTNDLKLIAKRTGGKYWDITRDPSAVASSIKQEIKPQPVEFKEDGNKDGYALLALALGGITYARFRIRRRETLNQEVVNQ